MTSIFSYCFNCIISQVCYTSRRRWCIYSTISTKGICLQTKYSQR